MQLYEDEAKAIFSQFGIMIPQGKVVTTPEEAVAVVQELGSAVIKVYGVKGRAKSGGIAMVTNPEEAREAATKLLKGSKMGKLIIEQRENVRQELYVAITVDFSQCWPVLIVSAAGGIDIEVVAAKEQEKIVKFPIDITAGLTSEQAKAAASAVGMPELEGVLLALWKLFRRYDAETVEINPLAVTDRGLVALDAVLTINDDSLSRHAELAELAKARLASSDIERQAAELGWSYIDMDGDIGILASGAGMTIATLDLIHFTGGRAANFLDLAQVDGDGIYRAFKLLEQNPRIKVIFVNLFAGLNRCDDMAQGIARYVAEQPSKPIVVRMIGNREDEGYKILRAAGIEPFRELEAAVESAVKIARGG